MGNAVGGGLKLKGAKDAGVKKKKKKSKTADAGDGDKAQQSALQKALADEDKDDDETGGSQVAGTRGMDGALETTDHSDHKDYGKTEAQKRQEELRRKRVSLEERLKKEGIKTHKERVEELNKYLSGLSEHHDMPRI